MEKNEILSTLYSIRAGLSAISVENEPLEKGRKEVERLNGKIKNNKMAIGACRNAIPNAQRSKQEYKRALKESKVGVFSYILLMVSPVLSALFAAGIGGVVGAIVATFVWEFGDNSGALKTGYVLTYAIPFAIISALVTGIVVGIITLRPIITQAKEDKRRNSEDIRRCENDVSYNQQKLVKLTKDGELLKEQKVIAADRYNKDAEITVPVIKAMYQTLEESYATILDPRDWENLDLLIYYISTGRADTLKEALQQVDRLKQTAMIVNAIGEASKNICQSIEVNISALRADLNHHFSALSIQLGKQHDAQMRALNKISAGVSSVGSKLDVANTNAKLQTALLKKIDTNSQVLANVATDIYYNGVKTF